MIRTEFCGGKCSGGSSITEDCNTHCCPGIKHLNNILYVWFIVNIQFRVFVVNCQWTSWTNGACSKSCGGGSTTKTRTKMITESCGGKCTGSSSITENCNIQCCPGTKAFVHVL